MHHPRILRHEHVIKRKIRELSSSDWWTKINWKWWNRGNKGELSGRHGQFIWRGSGFCRKRGRVDVHGSFNSVVQYVMVMLHYSPQSLENSITWCDLLGLATFAHYASGEVTCVRKHCNMFSLGHSQQHGDGNRPASRGRKVLPCDKGTSAVE